MEKKWKKRLQTAVLLAAGAVLFGSGMKTGAATAAEPGSVGDPLITQSYLEQRLSAGSVYECVTLAKGSTLELSQGAQLILYTGSAKIKGSLIDTTAGTLTSAGTGAERYHTYLAPADGSGLTAQAACVIFVNDKEQ